MSLKSVGIFCGEDWNRTGKKCGEVCDYVRDEASDGVIVREGKMKCVYPVTLHATEGGFGYFPVRLYAFV